MELGFAEELLFNTVRIQGRTHDGNGALGTGFIFDFIFGEELVPCLITNKHVIEGLVEGTFCFTREGENGEPLYGEKETYTMQDFESKWLLHPNPDVDLAIMFLAPLLLEAKRQGVKLFFVRIGEDSIISKENLGLIDAIDDVVMVGYPNGLWDEYNNLPIIRKGVTATHPNIDYGNKKEFMIDAATFPGSSGSPVFFYKPGSTLRLKHDTRTRHGNIFALMGVLYAGPVQNINGEVRTVNIPTKSVSIAEMGVPINLGMVIKAEKLLDFKPIIKEFIGFAE